MDNSTPDAPQEPNLARNGKIASLPLVVRDELNRRLDNGERGPKILEWLNAEKLAREVIDQVWSGREVTQQNLSEWRQGGYLDWRRRREKVEMLADLSGHALKLGEAAGGNVADGSAAIIGSKIMAAIESATLEDSLKMAKTVHRLRAGDRGRARLEMQRRKLDQRDAMIELERQRYRRETTILFEGWYKSRKTREIVESRANNREKIEQLGRAIFGEDWSTAEEEFEEFWPDI